MAGSVQSGLVPPPPAVYIRTRIVVLYLHLDCGVKVALVFWVLELHSWFGCWNSTRVYGVRIALVLGLL